MYEDEFELTFQVPEEESAPEPLAVPAAKPAAPVADEPTRIMTLEKPAAPVAEEPTRVITLEKPAEPQPPAPPQPEEPAPQPVKERPAPAAPAAARRVLISGGDRGIGAAAARAFYAAGYRVAVLCGGVARGQRLAAALEEHDVAASFAEKIDKLPEECVQVLPGTLTHGFIWEEARLIVVSDTDVYGTGYRKAKKRQAAGEKIAAFTDLKPGDFVVHEEHGVGIYLGTAQMKNGGTRRDYLQIQYQGSDKLYVPIEALSRVQRYIGNPANPPKLNKLGGGDWQKQKAKVKEGLKKMAFDLVKLYARRSQETGFAFSADTPWQREFEDMFPYELTPDQEQSVKEITADMESPRNMDRLLCGDVGYGKTEVSLRAAFKALMDSKQVAILAPTTILAQQHYNTFVQRMKDFPVRVDLLCRFRTASQQKKTIGDLKKGLVDILIGTHRVLSKDVQFKDLGLLIIDEEQRFGVTHKEKIKQMKQNIDVLTLTATPIPRTLHMSLIGIRDMSVLEEAPQDRTPIQTYVMEYNDEMVREAISRELARGGQVYYVYNRVNNIEEITNQIRKLVPEASVAFAHGQMSERELESCMDLLTERSMFWSPQQSLRRGWISRMPIP